ncbi:hypothetical protein DCAR_0104007 [Daucus carota subsp. sativus]|uniref:Uncharacterized protein n=1 Tax=Daucus carota subsp. sativus TaxID=79200 RepID=A0A166IGU9_DAUCS|nr:hypothetical protein DCAR_0104007 [Daucus carota subsp. sativus]
MDIVSVGGFDFDLVVRNTMTVFRKWWLGMLLVVRDVISWTFVYGDMDSAKELFDELPVKDMVAWTAMVTGFGWVISACAQLGSAKYAGWLRNIAEESGYRPTSNVVVGSAFVEMWRRHIVFSRE